MPAQHLHTHLQHDVSIEILRDKSPACPFLCASFSILFFHLHIHQSPTIAFSFHLSYSHKFFIYFIISQYFVVYLCCLGTPAMLTVNVQSEREGHEEAARALQVRHNKHIS